MLEDDFPTKAASIQSDINEVDLEYAENSRDLHNDYPLAPECVEIEKFGDPSSKSEEQDRVRRAL